MRNVTKLARSQGGFTLVELIVVMVILSLLLSVTVPSMTQWIAKSKIEKAKTECRACVVAAQTLAVEKYSSNRPEDSVTAWIANTDQRSEDITLLAAVSGSIAANKTKGSGSGDGVTFESSRGYTVTYLKYYYTDAKDVYIEYFYPGDLVSGADDASTIPTPGTSTAKPTAIATATASPKPTATPVETVSPKPTATAGNTYPGTSLPIGDNIWPKQSDYDANVNGNQPINPSGIFQWTDGNYYVITKASSLTKSQAAGGPGGEVNGWFATEKLTGKIWQPSDFVNSSGTAIQRSDVIRGDLYYDGEGSYYIFNDGGSYGYAPTVAGSAHQWYKIP